MTLVEVQKMLDAGFTHDEIMSFAKEPETKAPEAKEPETKAPEAKEPETKAPEAKEPETKAPEANDSIIKELKTTVDNLIKTIQESNLQNTFSSSAGENKSAFVDDALSQIIRPKN